jgi:glycine/D-amino acid oxidase-like deaminating enzyme
LARPEITIRGAGIFGLSIAWELTCRGARVRIVDPQGPLAGASGGLVGALAPHVPENWNDKKAFQLHALLMAQEWWAKVAEASGQDPGYARLGRVQPLADAQAVARAESRALDAARIWKNNARWLIRPGGRDFDPPSDSGLVLEDTLSARLSPRRAGEALMEALRQSGVVVQRDAADEGQVVWATGAQGLRELTAQLGRDMGRGEKGQAMSVRLYVPDQPQVYVDGLHIVPHADGTVAIGSTSERNYDDPSIPDAQLEALHARAIEAMPLLETAPIVTRWAGERPRSKTRAPLLGPCPDRAGHYIANGGFKIGFGIAPGVARAISDLVLDGHDTIPLEFRP